MKKILSLILLLGSLIPAYCQPSHLSFDHFNVLSGLPESYITCMVQDQQGYIWIATQNGLVKYDGYKLKVYKPGSENKHNFPQYVITDVFEDGKHTLWAKSLANGLYRYDRKTDHFVQMPRSKVKRQELSWNVQADSAGNIWSVIANINLAAIAIERYDPVQGKFTRYDQAQTGKHHLPFKKIAGFFIGPTGQVWLSGDNGLYLYEPGTDSFRDYLNTADSTTQKTFTNIYQERQNPNVLWLDGYGSVNKKHALWRYDIRSGQQKQFNHHSQDPYSIANDTVSVVFEDTRHEMWLVQTVAYPDTITRMTVLSIIFPPPPNLLKKQRTV